MSKKEEGPRCFVEFLRNVGYGDALRDLSDELHTLNNAMQDQALALNKRVTGELTLKLKFSQDERGVAGVAYEVVRKDPKKKTSESVFFVTKGGNLQIENPRQQKMPFRDVSAPEAQDVDFDESGDSEVV